MNHRLYLANSCLLISLLTAGCAGTESGPEASFPLADDELPIETTPSGVALVRTPDVYFQNLPDWPYEAQYVEIDGLRQAYVDVGPRDADPILLLHGQPSWSYLYRHMIPVLVDAGHRVIAMDHLGMGRSDKPIDLAYHSFLNHTHRLEAFIEQLELRHITAFVQDWGSLIGLYVIGLHPEWFDRVAVGDGTLPRFPAGITPFPIPEDIDAAAARFKQSILDIPAQQPRYYDEDGNPQMNADSGYFGDWIAFAMHDDSFRAATIVEAMTYFPLTAAETAAYDAPFPARITMAGPRTFPSLANTLGGVTEASWEGLSGFDKPFVTIWAGNDPGQLGRLETQQDLIDNIPGAKGQPHTRLPEASHFLQDDQGAEIARLMNEFIVANPVQ